MPPTDPENFDNSNILLSGHFPSSTRNRSIHSIEGYLEACRDAIKGHQSLYQEPRILHRDVSKNKIIIADADKDGDPREMLIDLDFAKELNTGLSGARHSNGIHGHQGSAGHTHTYRHDLENATIRNVICN